MGNLDPPRMAPLLSLPRLLAGDGVIPLCGRMGRKLEFMGPDRGLGCTARSTGGTSRLSLLAEFVGWQVSLGPRAHGAVPLRTGDLGARLLCGRPSRSRSTTMPSASSVSGFVGPRMRSLPRPRLPSASPRSGGGWRAASLASGSTMPLRTPPRVRPFTPWMATQLTSFVS